MRHDVLLTEGAERDLEELYDYIAEFDSPENADHVLDQFQFRTVGMEPLRVLIGTVPRWPGPDEAVTVAGPWPEKPPQTLLEPSIPKGR